MKVRDIIAALEADGWFAVRTRGDHRQYHYPTKRGTVTVRGQRNDDLSIELIKSIERQAGMRLR